MSGAACSGAGRFDSDHTIALELHLRYRGEALAQWIRSTDSWHHRARCLSSPSACSAHRATEWGPIAALAGGMSR